jgi:hypothetical protein
VAAGDLGGGELEVAVKSGGAAVLVVPVVCAPCLHDAVAVAAGGFRQRFDESFGEALKTEEAENLFGALLVFEAQFVEVVRAAVFGAAFA